MARILIVRREGAPVQRAYTHHRKKIRRNQRACNSLSISRICKYRLAGLKKRHIFEALALRAPISIVGIRDTPFAFSGPHIALPKEGKPVGMGIWKRTEESGVCE